MTRKRMFGLLAIIVVVASIGSVAAFGGKFSILDPQGQDNIVNAIKAKDFTAWKNAMSAQLTEENFNKLVERQEATAQRHLDMSEKRAMHSGTWAFNEEMNQAIIDGNYDAWKTAAEKANSIMISKIDTQDKFNLLVQLYQAKQDGNYAKVKELSTQLGLTAEFGKHKMLGEFRRGRNI